MKLIAKVRVIAMFAGVRAEFAPGESKVVVEVDREPKEFSLSDLPQHDIEQLLEMDAIEDTVETERADRAAERQERFAANQFEAERNAVKAATASAAKQVDPTAPAAPAADTTSEPTSAVVNQGPVTAPPPPAAKAASKPAAAAKKSAK